MFCEIFTELNCKTLNVLHWTQTFFTVLLASTFHVPQNVFVPGCSQDHLGWGSPSPDRDGGEDSSPRPQKWWVWFKTKVQTYWRVLSQGTTLCPHSCSHGARRHCVSGSAGVFHELAHNLSGSQLNANWPQRSRHLRPTVPRGDRPELPRLNLNLKFRLQGPFFCVRLKQLFKRPLSVFLERYFTLC